MTTFPTRTRTTRAVVLAIVTLSVCLSGVAVAQERPAPATELAAGTLLFADDGIVTEPFLGGNVRIYVSPRISIGPEIAFISGERHSHLMLTGNVVFDLLRPAGDQPRALTPFLVVGGGLFRTREEFPFGESFSSTEGAFTAGGGVRAHLGRRVIVGAEARLGWEAHVRVNGFAGIRFP
jgi:hypothetical protein